MDAGIDHLIILNTLYNIYIYWMEGFVLASKTGFFQADACPDKTTLYTIQHYNNRHNIYTQKRKNGASKW